MKPHEKEHLVRDYLLGKLNAADKQAFEAALAADAALARETALQRAEMEAAETLLAEEARQWFRAWDAPPAPQPPVFAKKAFWAASLAVVGAASAWLFFSKTNAEPVPQPAPKMEQTPPAAPPKSPPAPVAAAPKQPARRAPNYLALAEKFHQEPLLANVRAGAADTSASALSRAKAAYLAGDFAQALALADGAGEEQRQSAAFLAAHALFHLHRFSEAEIKFVALAEAGSRQYSHASAWGAALSGLANPARRKAGLVRLDAILQQPEHPYFRQARALKNAL